MVIQDLLIFLVQRLPKSVKSDRVRSHTLEHFSKDGPPAVCRLFSLTVVCAVATPLGAVGLQTLVAFMSDRQMLLLLGTS